MKFLKPYKSRSILIIASLKKGPYPGIRGAAPLF